MRIGLIVPGGVGRDGKHRVIPAILSLLSRLTVRHDVLLVVPNQESRPGTYALHGAVVHNVVGRRWEARAVRKLLALHRQQPLDVLHALWARGPGEVALVAARLARLPFLVHLAGGELVRMPEIGFGSVTWRRALARRVLRSADRVTAASEPMIRMAAEACVDAVRVPLGADRSVWEPTAPRRRPRGAPLRLVSVGSLTPVKGHATLLDALVLLREKYDDVTLDLVGEDTSGGAIPKRIRALGLEDVVKLCGFLPQPDVIPVVRAADIFVVSSLHEAGPVAMLEAAAVGVPTVGSAVGHVTEWAPDAAVAVPSADPRALSAAIGRLGEDEECRVALARRAQARALREDADWTAEAFSRLYQEVIAQRVEQRRG